MVCVKNQKLIGRIATLARIRHLRVLIGKATHARRCTVC
jgi:hypothetical protein